MNLFASAVNKANLWIRDVAEELGTENPNEAYAAVRAVLHALRDVLPISENTQLAAQLPLILRGIYFEGWRPDGERKRIRTEEEFYELVEANYHGRKEVKPALVTQVVLFELSLQLSDGELNDIKHSLPEALRVIWPPIPISVGNL